MLQRLSKFITAAGMAAALAAGSIPRPAAASTQSTINTVLGAAAVIGGIILYNNYQHKRQAANTIVGYTRNGGTVFGDGRIVMPNGQTIYPNSDGTYPWGQSAYYNQNANGYTYDTQRTGQWDRTHRHGIYHNSYNGAYNVQRPVQRPVQQQFNNPARRQDDQARHAEQRQIQAARAPRARDDRGHHGDKHDDERHHH